MIFEFNIFIPGKPLPLGRPRATKDTCGHIKMYTPKMHKEYQKFVGWKVKDKMNKDKLQMCLNPMEIKIKFYTYGKSDLDNLVKNILDAMNGILYKDDSQVLRIEAEKINVKSRSDCGIDIWASDREQL